MLLQRRPPFKLSSPLCVWASESVVTSACNCGLIVKAQYITWRLAQSALTAAHGNGVLPTP